MKSADSGHPPYVPAEFAAGDAVDDTKGSASDAWRRRPWFLGAAAVAVFVIVATSVSVALVLTLSPGGDSLTVTTIDGPNPAAQTPGPSTGPLPSSPEPTTAVTATSKPEPTSLSTEQPSTLAPTPAPYAFLGRRSIYFPSQFPNVSGTCPGTDIISPAGDFQDYSSLEDCLRCCSEGCQATQSIDDGPVVRGKSCVGTGERRNDESQESATDFPDWDTWDVFNVDYGELCVHKEPLTCSDDLGEEYTAGYEQPPGECSGYKDLATCAGCCWYCGAEVPSATFGGRGCVQEGKEIWRVVAGRPLMDPSSGASLLTPLVPLESFGARSRWASDAPSSSSSSSTPGGPGGALAAAAAWETQARAEHASVASFSSHLQCLLRIGGAPPDILEAAAAAAAEEVRHARKSLEVAALLKGPSGALLVPGPLRVPSEVGAEAPTYADIAAEVFKNGCVEETLSAGLAVAADLWASSDTGVPGAALSAARATAASIAEEEAGHAHLAWRTVAWALAMGGGGAAEAVRGELRRVEAGLLDEEATSGGGGAAEAQPHYALITSERQKAAVHRTLKAALVVPWAKALLASVEDAEASLLGGSFGALDGGGKMRGALSEALFKAANQTAPVSTSADSKHRLAAAGVRGGLGRHHDLGGAAHTAEL